MSIANSCSSDIFLTVDESISIGAGSLHLLSFCRNLPLKSCPRIALIPCLRKGDSCMLATRATTKVVARPRKVACDTLSCESSGQFPPSHLLQVLCDHEVFQVRPAGMITSVSMLSLSYLWTLPLMLLLLMLLLPLPRSISYVPRICYSARNC